MRCYTRRLHLSLNEILPHSFQFSLGGSEHDHSSFVFRQSWKSTRQVGKQRAASGHGRTTVTRWRVRPTANHQPEFGIWNYENGWLKNVCNYLNTYTCSCSVYTKHQQFRVITFNIIHPQGIKQIFPVEQK